MALMKAVNEGRIWDHTPRSSSHWDLCIQCRACEVASARPGVPYGSLIEATMAQVESAIESKSAILAHRLVSLLMKRGILPAPVAPCPPSEPAIRLYQGNRGIQMLPSEKDEASCRLLSSRAWPIWR